ncbi:MAG: hypothetical protein ACJA1R_001546 [Flavobacteriales bacterium]|jgi:hypothetical protein
MKPHLIAILPLFILSFAGCSDENDTSSDATIDPAVDGGGDVVEDGAVVTGERDVEMTDTVVGIEAVTVTVTNDGTGGLGGHTPRGFQGEGTGLFAGDDLSASFPDRDGVQIFTSFDLSDVPLGEILSAELSAVAPRITGTPFADLGNLLLEEVTFDAFSSELWDLPETSGGFSCTFASDIDGPYGCDIAPIVTSALGDTDSAQVRILFETAGDGDGAQDMAAFFLSDVNTNEAGIFSLEITVLPAPE